MRFLDQRLTVDVGIKSPNTRMRATANPGVETSIASGTLTAKESVLPQVGLGFKLNANNELFASYAENIAAFVGGGSGGPLQEPGSRLPYLRREVPGVHRRLQREVRQPPAGDRPMRGHPRLPGAVLQRRFGDQPRRRGEPAAEADAGPGLVQRAVVE
ncbi:hypothetical protein G6F66_014354 [Rhizopus arrhizus]|nr:hypothetical protein G6F66_014354 [Rhizopus arrhizus]